MNQWIAFPTSFHDACCLSGHARAIPTPQRKTILRHPSWRRKRQCLLQLFLLNAMIGFPLEIGQVVPTRGVLYLAFLEADATTAYSQQQRVPPFRTNVNKKGRTRIFLPWLWLKSSIRESWSSCNYESPLRPAFPEWKTYPPPPQSFMTGITVLDIIMFNAGTIIVSLLQCYHLCGPYKQKLAIHTHTRYLYF